MRLGAAATTLAGGRIPRHGYDGEALRAITDAGSPIEAAEAKPTYVLSVVFVLSVLFVVFVVFVLSVLSVLFVLFVVFVVFVVSAAMERAMPLPPHSNPR